MRTVFRTVVRFFLTGVATLLPLVVTVFVVTWLVRLADSYIGPSSSFGRFLISVFGAHERYINYAAGYLVVILLLTLLGFLVTRATIARLRAALDAVVARIPLIGKIYAAVAQVVELFGKKDEGALNRFMGIVQIQLGQVKGLALLTSAETYVLNDGREYVLVFVPNSPMPATGFNLFVPVEEICQLDLPVDDLAKVLLSLGLLGPQVLREPLKKTCLEGQVREQPASEDLNKPDQE